MCFAALFDTPWAEVLDQPRSQLSDLASAGVVIEYQSWMTGARAPGLLSVAVGGGEFSARKATTPPGLCGSSGPRIGSISRS